MNSRGRRARAWLARMIARRRFLLWYWMVAGILLGCWTLISRTLIPWLIGRAHAGAPLIERLLAARDRIALDEYLAHWVSLQPGILFVALTVVLLVFLLLGVLRQPLVAGITQPGEWTSEKARGAAREASGPLWSGGAIVAVGAWLGLLTGLGEAYFLTWNSFVLGRTLQGFRHVSHDSLWMAPLADMTAFMLLGAFLVGAGRWKPRARSGMVVLSAFGFLTLHTWAMVTGRVWWWASALLAAGIAIRLACFVTPKVDAFKLLAQRGAPWLAGVTVGVTASVMLSPIVPERRAMAALPAPPGDAPNVLLIVLDTQRAANTSLYGHLYQDRRETTPNLERWAESAVVFDRAIAPAPWTLPSHASMFTGRLNRELGTGFMTPLDNRYPTLAEVLQANGYVTAGFVANLGFGSDFYGLDRGFTHYRDQPRNIGMALESSWLTRVSMRRAREWLGNRESVVRKRGGDLNREFLAWLATKPEQPFFAFLNYFDPHAPYKPPAPFDTLFMKAEGRYHLEDSYSSEHYSAQEVEELEAAYDESIAYLDHEVDRLLNTLGSEGILGNTLVIVTSDHGESFAEHGWLGHANSLHLSELHVPLLIRPPGGVRPGRRVEQVVSLRDIAATVLDFVGIEPTLPGRSLAASFDARRFRDVDGERPELSRAYAVSELRTRWLSIVGGGYHYLRRPDGSEELYDIDVDRLESANLAQDPDRSVILEKLRRELANLTGDTSLTDPPPSRVN